MRSASGRCTMAMSHRRPPSFRSATAMARPSSDQAGSVKSPRRIRCGLPAVGARHPQIALAVDVRNAVQLGRRPAVRFAVVRRLVARPLEQDERVERQHVTLLNAAHVRRIPQPAVEAADADIGHLRVRGGRDAAKPGRTEAACLSAASTPRQSCSARPESGSRSRRREPRGYWLDLAEGVTKAPCTISTPSTQTSSLTMPPLSCADVTDRTRCFSTDWAAATPAPGPAQRPAASRSGRGRTRRV